MGRDNLDIAGEVRRAISQSDRIVKERERAAGVVSDAALCVQAKDGCSRRSAVSGVSSIHEPIMETPNANVVDKGWAKSSPPKGNSCVRRA